MQLWQKKNSNFTIENLWQKTQADIKKIFQPDALCSQRLLPHQYLSAIQDDKLFQDAYSGKLDSLTEKFFWERICGGHPRLQSLFNSFELTATASEFKIWGHEILEVLGHGSSSVVYRTAGQFALKVVCDAEKQRLFREYSLLSEIQCKNIVKVFDFYESPYGAGMLLEFLMPPSCDNAGYSAGLEHLHQNGVCHGDIRYTNLGASKNGTAKLFDFGKSFYGTAEEMLNENITLKLLLEKFNRIER